VARSVVVVVAYSVTVVELVVCSVVDPKLVLATTAGMVATVATTLTALAVELAVAVAVAVAMAMEVAAVVRGVRQGLRTRSIPRTTDQTKRCAHGHP
jgi:hypothetical protein